MKTESFTVTPNYLSMLGISAPVYKNKLLNNVKIGTPFQFSPMGQTYVRCRGGYRPGRGGPLVTHSPDQIVLVGV